MNEYREREADRPTFEDTYPMYDFAPLVAIILALGGWIAGLQRARATQAPRAVAQASEGSGPEAHAT